MELDEHFPSNSSSPDCLSKKCYFSELNDLSKEADYYELYKIHSSNDFKSPNTKKAHSNATMQIQNDKDLIIISKGGMVFSLPLDQKIERIFPISDGLIIEFFIKQEPKLSGLLNFYPK